MARWMPLVLGFSSILAAGPSASSRHAQAPARLPDEGRASLAFVENRGQWPRDVRYCARLGRARVAAGASEIRIHLSPDATSGSTATQLGLRFLGASPDVALEGVAQLPGLYSYFLGNDPSKWVKSAPSFARVRWQGLYPGIDLVLRDESGHLEYDLFVAPGADLAQVVVRCEGARALDLGEAGSLVLDSAAGPLRQTIGRSWQVLASGEVRELRTSLRLLDERSFGFAALDRDPALALVIDPGLVWSTYLGSAYAGNPGDLGYAVAVGPEGNVTVVGAANGTDFPNTPQTYQHPNTNGTHEDIFVTRLRGSDGALLYSCLIGGSHPDRARAVAVDRHGRAVVAGWPVSLDFPTTPGAFDPTFDNYGGSSFVLRLNSAGTDLEYSTFIEGTQDGDDFEAEAIAIDGRTGAVVVGGGGDGSLPATSGAFDATYDGVYFDGFLVKLNPTGSALEWATFLGGFGYETIYALAIDGRGRVAVSGATSAADFPVTPGAFQTQLGPPPIQSGSAFVTVLDPTGSQLVWSSYLGSSLSQDVAFGYGIALDPVGGVIVAGSYGSPSATNTFPTTPGAWQTNLGGSADAYITRFTPDGSALVYSTLLGGPAYENIYSLAVDASGVATVSGSAGPGFPFTPGAFDSTWGGALWDAFVARVNPSGTRLLYSSYLGGLGQDWGYGLAVSATGRTTIGGHTDSPDFPTTAGAISPSYVGGQSDAFVATLDLVLEGVRPFGASTPACKGPLQLNALEVPASGSGGFGFYVSGAPPSSFGWLCVGSGLAVPAQALGVDFFLDPQRRIVRIPTQTDADGYAEIAFPLGWAIPGTRFEAQVLVRNTPECRGTFRFSATNAVRIAVQ